MNNRIGSIVLSVFKVILSLLIVCVFCIVFMQRISNNALNFGGYSIYTVVSESMAPEYKLWDMILVHKVDVSDIKKYDDVVYMGSKGDFKDKIVTHRVMEISSSDKGYVFKTKGINNSEYDPLVNGDQILGKVVFKSVVFSFISRIINNIYGFYFLVFVPLVVIVFLEIVESINERRESKKKKSKSLYKIIRKRVKFSSLCLLLLTLSVNTFAWFIYATKVDSGVKAHIRAWNVLFEVHNEEIQEEMGFDVSDIFPGMEDYRDSVEIRNKGESSALISYEIVSVNVLGHLYEVGKGGILSSDDLVNSLARDYPFLIGIEIEKPIIKPNETGSFTLNVSWPYESGNDEVDTYWGNEAYTFQLNNPDSSSIHIGLKVTAKQISG